MTTTDLRPQPPTTDVCHACGHPWIAHNPLPRVLTAADPVGCDGWANPGAPPRELRRCGCLEGPPPAAREEMVLRPITPKRPGWDDNPGDSLAAVQEMYDRAETVLDRLAPLLDRLDLVDRDAMALAHGGTKVYLAWAFAPNSVPVILGVSTTGEGALAYIGSAVVLDESGLSRYEVLTLELDDPTGKVIK